MRIRLSIVAILAMAVLAPACAGTDHYESAESFRRQGRCDQAVEEYSRAIEGARGDHELARAYYFRSLCREELGQAGPAYADAYAALRMSCYLAATERDMRTRPLGFVIGPAYCRGEGPARLAKLGGELTEQETLRMRLAVEQELPGRIRETPLPEHAR